MLAIPAARFGLPEKGSPFGSLARAAVKARPQINGLPIHPSAPWTIMATQTETIPHGPSLRFFPGPIPNKSLPPLSNPLKSLHPLRCPL